VVASATKCNSSIDVYMDRANHTGRSSYRKIGSYVKPDVKKAGGQARALASM